ncbi:hypothetical protein ACIQUL_29825 [Streptomyces sp. NPDC090303]|uniref:hypothetical protein n=1 Tax=Streptomyces sp. NPDC090303 TaxID=3365960 RepID=UPI0038049F59
MHAQLDYDYAESIVVRLFVGSGLQEGCDFPELSVIVASAADAETRWAAHRIAALPVPVRSRIEAMLSKRSSVMQIVRFTTTTLISGRRSRSG